MAGNVAQFPLILLCGGKSSRMGEPKGLMLVGGRPWVERQIDSFRAAGGERVLLVLGYEKERYLEALGDLPVIFVVNEKPEFGPFSSITSAVTRIEEPGAFILPVDVPVPDMSVWKNLAEALRAEVRVCVPVFDDKAGHPVLASRRFLEDLIRLPMDGVESRLDLQIRNLASDQRTSVPVNDERILLNLNSPVELDQLRYSRQIMLPEIGPEGQERLRKGSVLLVGAGGLGSAAGIYLAAAGVGRIGIADFDRVEESNLHRQILYTTSDVGRPKLDAAVGRLRAVKPEIKLALHDVRLTAENAAGIFQNYDVVVDGTDNYPAKYAVHDTCARIGKPSVYGAVRGFEGHVSVFDARRGPCYRCLYPIEPQDRSGKGVFGVLPGLIGTIQATEAAKLLLCRGQPLIGRLLVCNALSMEFREVKLRPNPECRLCRQLR